MSKDIARNIINLTWFFVLLSFLNLVFNSYFKIIGYKLIIGSNLFLYFLTGLVLFFFVTIAKKDISKAGYSFIAMMLFKIIAILLFLKALKFMFDFENKFILNFAIIYLLYLFFNMFLALKTLNKLQKDKK